jgi:hypothetical protein
MKRLLTVLLTCIVLLWSFVMTNSVQAQPLPTLSRVLAANVAESASDLLKKVETEILPKLESLLSTEQRDQFKTAVAEGSSFRKAFKAITLSPEQKAQLGQLFQSLPKKDLFASLTPDQKKQLFMKKKELFIPTPEEIGDKISQKMKIAKEKGGAMVPEGIGEKVAEKMKMAKEKMAG